MPLYIAGRLTKIIDDRRQKSGNRILLLGITYKPDVADTRETPARKLVSILEELGFEAWFHDPHVDVFLTVRGFRVPFESNWLENRGKYCASVILQPHAEYLEKMIPATDHIMFDCTGRFRHLVSHSL